MCVCKDLLSDQFWWLNSQSQQQREREIWRVWKELEVCMCMVGIDMELKIPSQCGPSTPTKHWVLQFFLFHSLPSLSPIFLPCDHLLHYNPMIQCLYEFVQIPVFASFHPTMASHQCHTQSNFQILYDWTFWSNSLLKR